jgi:hypothetical protein
VTTETEPRREIACFGHVHRPRQRGLVAPCVLFPPAGRSSLCPVSQIVVDGALTRVSPVRAVLDRGHVSAHVLATDVGTPTGCTWQVRHRIGGDFEQFDIEAPSGAEIDLPTVTPISASRGTGVNAQVRTVPVGTPVPPDLPRSRTRPGMSCRHAAGVRARACRRPRHRAAHAGAALRSCRASRPRSRAGP